jgi:hypothetical protein
VAFRGCFTRRGWRRFVQWVTALVFGWEEHTITQVLISLGLADLWRCAEAFAERGRWDRDAVEQATATLIHDVHGELWHGYAVYATDDTKVHRTSQDVWGTCTFHEYTSRCPNRAETVRAHNWVVRGRLLCDEPWWFLPTQGRLYFRRSQVPTGESFRKKPALLVEMVLAEACRSPIPLLEVFDGGYAVQSVVRPLLAGACDAARIEVLTRLREDSRLYRPLRGSGKHKGRPRKWGRRFWAPKHAGRWPGSWRDGHAWVYGRRRRVRWKQALCQWHVAGPDRLVHAFVFEVEGEKKQWCLVCSALELTGPQVVGAFAARFRQEDGFRDLKQRLGAEECRAWTAAPIQRTFQAQMVAMTLMRLLHFRMDEHAIRWWAPPAWNGKKRHPSILDVRRWLWRFRQEFSHFLLRMHEVPKTRHRYQNPRHTKSKVG